MKELTNIELITIRDHYREACRARQQQWEHERQIEKIVGREILDFRIADGAVADAGEISLKDVVMLLDLENQIV